MTLTANVFRKLRTPKNIDQCLKSPFLEDPPKSNMVNAPNLVQIWRTDPLAYYLITGKSIVLQKVSISDMQILKTVS